MEITREQRDKREQARKARESRLPIIDVQMQERLLARYSDPTRHQALPPYHQPITTGEESRDHSPCRNRRLPRPPL